MPKYPPAAGVKPEDLVKALVRHRPAREGAEDEPDNDKAEQAPEPETVVAQGDIC